jgi:hypothetical protein
VVRHDVLVSEVSQSYVAVVFGVAILPLSLQSPPHRASMNHSATLLISSATTAKSVIPQSRATSARPLATGNRRVRVPSAAV